MTTTAHSIQGFAATGDQVTTATRGHTHVPALDGLRGVAILLVMAFHFINSLAILGVSTPLLTPFKLGWSGVDVFFALSGFLITGILLDAKTSNDYFKSFYIRRVLRIFPLYYIALLAVFVVRALVPEAGVWGERAGPAAPGNLIWAAMFLENAAILIGGGGGTGTTSHYWSLAVEEHFYLVWPFLVWLAKDRRQVLAMAAIAAAASLLGRGMILHEGLPIHRWFGVTPLRLDGLAIGAITAVLVRSYPRPLLTRWAAAGLPAAVLAAAALLLARHTTSDADPGLWLFFYPLVATGAAATIVLCLGNSGVASLMSLKPLRWFGKYSYGLYVWHPIVGILLLHSTIALAEPGDPPAQVIAAALAVLALDLAVAWLSFEIWEKRFLALKGRFTLNFNSRHVGQGASATAAAER